MRDFLATATAGIRPVKIQPHVAGRATPASTVQVMTKRPAKRLTYRGTYTKVRTFKIGGGYICDLNQPLSPEHLIVPAKEEVVRKESRLPIPTEAEMLFMAAKAKRDARNARRRARYAAKKQPQQ